ncbi:hemin uptake protein HemP [Limnohabitans sp. T6-5]|uniref:hemin uptake protein HemP n=1 Tax=Limnohabitans sp. T6-5 TaxID=1100724 RepID=UPI001E35338C|nr:hemin uptake protein HemP [Limnohabitans sp. T6-5]
MDETVVPSEAFTTPVSSASGGLRIIDSRDLLAGQSSLLIRHLGEVYRLQTTRQGKLILTK